MIKVMQMIAVIYTAVMFVLLIFELNDSPLPCDVYDYPLHGTVKAQGTEALAEEQSRIHV